MSRAWKSILGRDDGGGGATGRSARSALALLALGLVLAIAVTACGSSSNSSSSTASSTGGSGGSSSSEGGEGGEIVFFSYSRSDVYQNAAYGAMEEEAGNLGYKLKIIESQANPAEQNQQIQQYIASGEKPKAFLIFALDPKAAVAQTAQLKAIAPVFLLNQTIEESGSANVAAYMGPNDVKIGETAGENVLKLREKLEGENYSFKTEGGGLLVFNSPAGYAITAHRAEGIENATKGSGVELLEDNECCATPEEGLKIGLQLFAKYKSKVDFVYALNNAVATGVIQAAEKSGLEPGKNVFFVTGDCSGPVSTMTSGAVYATEGQYATVEGQAAMQMIARYFGSGEKSEPGEEILEASKTVPEVDLSSPPKEVTYLPNQDLVGPAQIKSGEVWGKPIAKACAAE
jgi:ABC-type sugar transport system substrate-binding protein